MIKKNLMQLFYFSNSHRERKRRLFSLLGDREGVIGRILRYWVMPYGLLFSSSDEENMGEEFEGVMGKFEKRNR